ncbi:MAG: hypothetical protein IKN57_03940 [Parasporobacterium sp.]|nr:hypothetical protein [Parasporobacterium sp.]
MGMKEIASRIGEANKESAAVLEEFHALPEADQSDLAFALNRYIPGKLQLQGEEVSDNITIMVRTSISKATGISLEKLKEMDRPGACGSAPAVLAKRVLLFLDIQKQLGITLPPEKLYGVQTIEDLTNLAYPLLEEKNVMA